MVIQHDVLYASGLCARKVDATHRGKPSNILPALIRKDGIVIIEVETCVLPANTSSM